MAPHRRMQIPQSCHLMIAEGVYPSLSKRGLYCKEGVMTSEPYPVILPGFLQSELSRCEDSVQYKSLYIHLARSH